MPSTRRAWYAYVRLIVAWLPFEVDAQQNGHPGHCQQQGYCNLRPTSVDMIFSDIQTATASGVYCGCFGWQWHHALNPCLCGHQPWSRTCYTGATWSGCREANYVVMPPLTELSSAGCAMQCTCDSATATYVDGNGDEYGTIEPCACRSGYENFPCKIADLTNAYANRDDGNIVYEPNYSATMVEVGGTAKVTCDNNYFWHDTKEQGEREVECKLGNGDCRYWDYNPFCIDQFCYIDNRLPVGSNVDRNSFTFLEPYMIQNSCGKDSTGYQWGPPVAGSIGIQVNGLMNYTCAEGAVLEGKDGSVSVTEQTTMFNVNCKGGGGGGDKGEDANFDKTDNGNGEDFHYNDPWDCVKTCPPLIETEGQVIDYFVDQNSDVTALPVLTDRYTVDTMANLTCTAPMVIPQNAVAKAICLNTGEWDQPLSNCSLTCPAPTFGNNVDVAGAQISDLLNADTEVHVGGVAEYQCAVGYIWNADPKTEPKKSTCGEDGTWAPITLAQMAVDHCFATCDEANVTANFTEPPHESYSEFVEKDGQTLFPLTTEVIITCKDTFVFADDYTIEETTVTCQPHPTTPIGNAVDAPKAYWDDVNKTCIPTCDPIVPREGESISYSTAQLPNSNYPMDAVATKTCKTDETIEMTCVDGVWTDASHVCSACYPPKSESEQYQHMAGMATASFSNLFLLACCVVLVILFILLLDFSLPRIYHMIQEVSLLLSIIAIIPARSPTLFDAAALCDPANPDYEPPAMSYEQCTLVSIALHYLYTVHFFSLLLEAIHNYTYYTHVFNKKSCIQRLTFLLIVLLIPLIIVVPPTFFVWDTYTNALTCWVNYGETISLVIVVPIACMALPAIIFSEATTMRPYPVHLQANEKWKMSAATNSKGGLIITLLSFAAYVFQTFAVYTVSMSLYMVASVLNIVLAVMLLLWHTLGSEKARKILSKCCPCLIKPIKFTPKSSIEPEPVFDYNKNPFAIDSSNKDHGTGKNTENDQGGDSDDDRQNLDDNQTSDDEIMELFDKKQPEIMAPKEAELPPSPSGEPTKIVDKESDDSDD